MLNSCIVDLNYANLSGNNKQNCKTLKQLMLSIKLTEKFNYLLRLLSRFLKVDNDY